MAACLQIAGRAGLFAAAQVNDGPLALLMPFEGEQRLRKHRRWCAGICGNSLLQAAEAGLDPILDEFNALFSYNKICVERLANVAAISADDAINYNLVGPNLRASGVNWDVRKDMP